MSQNDIKAWNSHLNSPIKEIEAIIKLKTSQKEIPVSDGFTNVSLNLEVSDYSNTTQTF